MPGLPRDGLCPKIEVPLNNGAAECGCRPFQKTWSAFAMAGDSYKYAGTLVRSVEKQNERRKIPRYAVNADSEVEEPRVQAKINGRMTDLGMGGCYVDAMMTFPVDTVVHMRMMGEDLKCEADARVIFSKPGLGMGLMFTDLTAAHQRYLAEWVDELSGTERVAAPATRSTPLNDEE